MHCLLFVIIVKSLSNNYYIKTFKGKGIVGFDKYYYYYRETIVHFEQKLSNFAWRSPNMSILKMEGEQKISTTSVE